MRLRGADLTFVPMNYMNSNIYSDGLAAENIQLDALQQQKAGDCVTLAGKRKESGKSATSDLESNLRKRVCDIQKRTNPEM